MSEPEGWLRVRRVDDGIWLLAEPPFTNSYLIRGSSRAVLFDTGLGFDDIRAVAESLVDVPLLVVNSHHHFDHVGGNHRFDDIGIHRSGADLLATPPPEEWLRAYAQGIPFALARFEEYRALDETLFHLLLPEIVPGPLPPGLDLDAWRTLPTVATRLLSDGDVVDLGDRPVRVIHTPGHTVDSISLLDEQTGSLFAGDTLSHASIYTHLPTGDLGELEASMRRLAREREERWITRIFVQHVLRYEAHPDLIDDVGEACRSILAGDATPRRTKDIFARDVVEYAFPRCAVVTGLWPPPDQGS